jgi:4-amino-4-deoxy-L-arabinose transferase-like glycosyltransferase
MLRHWLSPAVVFLLTLAVLGTHTALHPGGGRGDETDYIFTARYFNYLFVQHDVTRPEWGDNYWTHTQPMLIRYIEGAWLSALGYDLEATPEPYGLMASLEQIGDAKVASAPVKASPSLVARARVPIIALSGALAVVAYLIARFVGGEIAGWATVGLLLENTLFRNSMPTVQPESALLLALALPALILMRSPAAALLRPSYGRVVAVGLVLGLGLAAKLTAGLGIFALLLWGALATWRTASAARAEGQPGWWQVIIRVGGAWAAMALIAGGVFVLSDPHLYANPFVHTAHLLQNRVQEMDVQAVIQPAGAVNDPLQRPVLLLAGVAQSTITGSRTVSLEGLLMLLGVALAAARAWRDWRRRAELGPTAFLLVTLVVSFIGTSAGLRMRYDKYYLPILIWTSIFGGLAVAWLASSARQLLHANASARVLRSRPLG